MLPPLQQVSQVPLTLVSLPFPVRQQAASIVENLGTLLRIAPTQSRISQTINKVLGILLKPLQETDKCSWVKLRTWVQTFLLELSSWVMLRTWEPTFLS
jgi:hypothetical protein